MAPKKSYQGSFVEEKFNKIKEAEGGHLTEIVLKRAYLVLVEGKSPSHVAKIEGVDTDAVDSSVRSFVRYGERLEQKHLMESRSRQLDPLIIKMHPEQPELGVLDVDGIYYSFNIAEMKKILK